MDEILKDDLLSERAILQFLVVVFVYIIQTFCQLPTEHADFIVLYYYSGKSILLKLDFDGYRTCLWKSLLCD